MAPPEAVQDGSHDDEMSGNHLAEILPAKAVDQLLRTAPDGIPEITAAAAAVKRARFAGTVFPVAPLYVSSVCAEQCRYCNYRGGNRGVGVVRRRLTDDEVAAEAEWLIDSRGLRCVELVYASDPRMPPAVIARHVARVRALLDARGGGVVGLSAEPADADDYRRLRDAGLDFAVVWMETYDRSRWAALHPGRTRKADMDWRLGVYDRMIAGGLRSFGMGVLSGLSDWRRDWTALLAHEADLLDRHGIGPAILGIPRLKPAPGAPLQSTPEIPADDELRLAVAVHNLRVPAALPFVSTRESWDLCVQLAAGGGCLFTFDCSTIPGGYTRPPDGAQFPSWSFDAREYAPRLPAHGLRAEFDWRLGVSGPASPRSAPPGAHPG